MAAVLQHDTTNIVQRLARLNSYQARLAYSLVANYTRTCMQYSYAPAIYALAEHNLPGAALLTSAKLILGNPLHNLASRPTSRDTLLLQYKLMIRRMYGGIPSHIALLLRSYGMDITEVTLK